MGLDTRASCSRVWRARLGTSLGGNWFSRRILGREQPGSRTSQILLFRYLDNRWMPSRAL